jgi:hypothetical protein
LVVWLIAMHDILTKPLTQPAKGRDARNEKGGTKIDFVTMWVLIFTMFGVFWYAREAKKQTKQQILDSRPVLMPNGSFASGMENGLPLSVNPRIVNFGKTVAKDVVPIGHIVFGEIIPPTPQHTDCGHPEAPKDAWKTSVGSEQVVNSAWGWDEGPQKEPTPPGPFVYVVGCVYYKDLGDSPFYTDICLTWTPQAGLVACNDKSRNFVR